MSEQPEEKNIIEETKTVSQEKPYPNNCPNCKKETAKDDYYFNRRTFCKTCISEKNKSRYKPTKKERNERSECKLCKKATTEDDYYSKSNLQCRSCIIEKNSNKYIKRGGKIKSRINLEDLYNDFDAGFTRTELSEKYNMHYSTVVRYLKNRN